MSLNFNINSLPGGGRAEHQPGRVRSFEAIFSQQPTIIPINTDSARTDIDALAIINDENIFILQEEEENPLKTLINLLLSTLGINRDVSGQDDSVNFVNSPDRAGRTSPARPANTAEVSQQNRDITAQYGQIISQVAAELSQDFPHISQGQFEEVIAGTINRESRGNPRAHNPNDPGGSYGLCQLNKSVLDTYGITETQAYDPETNIRVAARLIRDLLEHYDGDLGKTLIAYGTGAGRMDQMLANNNHERINQLANEFVHPFIQVG